MKNASPAAPATIPAASQPRSAAAQYLRLDADTLAAHIFDMTATIEDLQSRAQSLIDVARRGEEVVITEAGQAVARLTAVPPPPGSLDRRAWLQRLGTLRARLATGGTGASIQQILDDDRGE